MSSEMTKAMPESSLGKARWLRLAVVIATFLLLFYGLTTLSAVIGFFGVSQRSPQDIIAFYATNAPILQKALFAALLGYILSVPVMAMVTRHYQGADRETRFGDLMVGLLWASLALRPLWWAAHLVLMPDIVALGAPGTNPAEIAAFMTAFRMLDTILNTVTEDIAVNVLGGAWFLLIGREILRKGGRMLAVGGITMLIGALYLLSSSELLGMSFGEGGGIIPVIASVSGPFWILFVGGAVALHSR